MHSFLSCFRTRYPYITVNQLAHALSICEPLLVSIRFRREACLHGHMKGSEHRATEATAELYSGPELLLIPDDLSELPLPRNMLPTSVAFYVFPAIRPLPW